MCRLSALGGLPGAAEPSCRLLRPSSIFSYCLSLPAWPATVVADDEDNFVVGLGLDCTSTSVPVQHPTDATAPDLAPQPVLLVSRGERLAGTCPSCY